MEKEVIYLDCLDGYEFQRVCAEILRRLRWGKIKEIRYTADGGRDIVLSGRDGLIIVECKHWLDGKVGKKVVEKLYSAVKSSKASKGIIITTGEFSSKAINHAHMISISRGIPIELINFAKLKELANSVGIKLAYSTSLRPYVFQISNQEELSRKIWSLFHDFMSAPNNLSKIAEAKPVKIILKAAFLVKYDINEKFYASEGSLIYSIDERNRYLVIDADNGSPLLHFWVSDLLDNTPIYDVKNLPKFPCEIECNEFKFKIDQVKEIATKIIVKMYTKRVRYKGRNYRTITKTCTPSKNSIYFRDIKQVYLPSIIFEIKIINHNYKCTAYDTPKNLKIISTDMFKCGICYGYIAQKPLVCNSCGKITHPPKRINSHGYICKKCGKTICKNCTYKIRYLLLFKKPLCKECYDQLKRIKL